MCCEMHETPTLYVFDKHVECDVLSAIITNNVVFYYTDKATYAQSCMEQFNATWRFIVYLLPLPINRVRANATEPSTLPKCTQNVRYH